MKAQSQAVGLLGIGFFLFFTFKLLPLLTAVENVSWPEELGVGTIAREILTGLKHPFWEYQLDHYSGESLVLGLGAAVLFKFFGANLLILKMLPFCCSVLTVLTAVVFLRRWFGFSSAFWALLLWSLSPPVFTSYFLVVMSGHSEVLLVTMLMLCAFYEFLFSRSRSPVFLFLFGLLGGFGFWFYHASGIAFVTCLFVWGGLRPQNVSLKNASLILLSFAAGMLPWVLSNPANFPDAAHFLTVCFRDCQGWSIYWINKRILGQVLLSLPRAFLFLPQSHSLSSASAYSYYFSFLVLCLPFYWSKIAGQKNLISEKEGKFLFFLLYPVLFCFIYAVTNLMIAYNYSSLIVFRYYTPFYFFTVILTALAIAEKKVPKIPLIIFLVFSLAAQSALCFKEPWGRAKHYLGYSYKVLGARQTVEFSPSQGIYAQFVQKAALYPLKESKIVFWSMLEEHLASNSFWQYSKTQNLEFLAFETVPLRYHSFLVETVSSYVQANCKNCKFEELIKRSSGLPAADQPYYNKGLLADYFGITAFRFFQDEKIINQVDPLYRHWIYWGMGNFLKLNPQDSEEQVKIQKVTAKFNEEESRWYYRGMGSAVFAGKESGITVDIDYPDEIKKTETLAPEIYRKDFYWGTGWQIGMFFPEDRIRAMDWINRLPEPARVSAREGLESFEKWYGLS